MDFPESEPDFKELFREIVPCKFRAQAISFGNLFSTPKQLINTYCKYLIIEHRHILVVAGSHRVKFFCLKSMQERFEFELSLFGDESHYFIEEVDQAEFIKTSHVSLKAGCIL